MTIESIIQQCTQHIQFFAMLGQLDVEWPAEWEFLTSWLSWFNVDPQYIFGQQSIPVIDFRTLFILPMYIVLWYVSICLGAMLLVVGAVGYLLPSQGIQQTETAALQFMVIGGALVALALIVALSYYAITKYRARGKNEELLHIEDRAYYLRFHRMRFAQHAAVTLLFILLGLLFINIMTITIPNLSSTDQTFGKQIFFIIGCIFFFFAACAFVFLLINLSHAGRVAVSKVSIFIRSHFLMVMLLLVSVSFIPVLTYCINMFMCADYTCPINHTFNPFAERAANSYDTSAARYCDSCVSMNTSAPCYNLTAFTPCPGYSGSRAWKNPDVPCDDEATVYFYLAAIIVMSNYIIGIPLLYLSVIKYLTTSIEENVVIEPRLPVETRTEYWQRMIFAIQPAAASLYEPFRKQRRYYLIFTMVHRLLITIALNVAAAYSSAAAVLVLLIHGVAGLTVFFFKPYLSKIEQALACCLSVANLLNGCYAIIVWQQGSGVPVAATGAFVLLNAIVPVCGTVIAKCIQRRDVKKAKERMALARKRQKLEQKIIYYREDGRDEEADALQKELDAMADPASEPYHTVSDVEEEEDMDETEAAAESEKERQAALRDEEVVREASMAASEKEPKKRRRRKVKDGEGNNDDGDDEEEESKPSSPESPPKSRADAYKASSNEPASPSARPPAPKKVWDRRVKPKDAVVVNDGSSDESELGENEHWEYMTAESGTDSDDDPEEIARKEKNKVLRETFDEHSTNTMNKAFMVMGVFFLIALGIAFLGTLRAAEREYLIGWSPLRQNIQNQLGGYTSWTEFTDNCCCITATTTSIEFNTTEKWICRNGKNVERGRVSKDLSHNSLPIRGLCQTSFITGCAVQVDGVTAKLICGTTQKAGLVPSQLSDRAYTYYW